MNIVISTVKRPNNSPYLDRLIDSIRQDWKGPIHLVIGGEDASYTDKYKKGFIKHFIGEEEKQFKDTFKKAAYGYFRCLTIDRTKPTLVFEDDGLLIKDWSKKLKNLITFVSEKEYILSLIIPFNGAVPAPDIDLPSIQRFVYYSKLNYDQPGELPTSTISTYCNTTGIYYPKSILQTRLPEFIYKFAVEGQSVHDLAVGQYMFRCNLPVYITVPPLLIKDIDSTDSSLGSVKKLVHVDYSDWDYKKP